MTPLRTIVEWESSFDSLDVSLTTLLSNMYTYGKVDTVSTSERARSQRDIFYYDPLFWSKTWRRRSKRITLDHEKPSRSLDEIVFLRFFTDPPFVSLASYDDLLQRRTQRAATTTTSYAAAVRCCHPRQGMILPFFSVAFF